MKSLLIGVICLMLIACQGNTQEKVTMKTQMDSVSYGIGLDIGKNLKAQSIEVNAQTLAAGIHDAVTGGKTLLTDEQVQKCMTEFQQQLMAKNEAKAHEMGEKNTKIGAEFLAANKSKEGVKTTPSGLQYKIEKQGEGKAPDGRSHVRDLATELQGHILRKRHGCQDRLDVFRDMAQIVADRRNQHINQSREIIMVH